MTMKYDEDNLCFGCMNILNDRGQCPNCDFDMAKYQMTPRCIRPGNRINRYVIGRVIGEGNFGITYIGRDLLLERVVAIKEYFPLYYVSRDTRKDNDNTVYVYNRKSDNSYQKELDRFYNEAKKLSKFYDVDGIVSVIDFFYANQTAYIVMAYVEGITLKEHIRSFGAMSGQETLTLMKPVIQALINVHREGIIHRDISPDNIIVNKYGKPVLIDFGSARQETGAANRSMTVMFKRGYTPEEQYREDGRQGTWTDVYALCATLYFMLTGIPPDEAIDRMLGDRLVSLCDMPEVSLSASEKRTIMWGMAVQADDRIRDMEQLLEELYGEKETGLSVVREKNRMMGKVIPAMLILFTGALFWSDNYKPEEMRKSVKSGSISQKTDRTDSMQDSPLQTKLPQAEPSQTEIFPTKIPQVERYRTQKPEMSPAVHFTETGRPFEKRYTVPDVTGLSSKEANKRLRQKKLKARFLYVSSEKQAGIVLKQKKEAGKKVKKGTRIVLTVSNGKKKKVTKQSESSKTKSDKRTSRESFDAKIPSKKHSDDDFDAKILE